MLLALAKLDLAACVRLWARAAASDEHAAQRALAGVMTQLRPAPCCTVRPMHMLQLCAQESAACEQIPVRSTAHVGIAMSVQPSPALRAIADKGLIIFLFISTCFYPV